MKEKDMANFVRTIATLKGAEEPLCSIRRIFDTAIRAEMAQEAGKPYRHEDGLLWQIIPMPPGLMDIESDGYVSDLAKGRSLESVLKKIEDTRIRRGGTPEKDVSLRRYRIRYAQSGKFQGAFYKKITNEKERDRRRGTRGRDRGRHAEIPHELSERMGKHHVRMQ